MNAHQTRSVPARRRWRFAAAWAVVATLVSSGAGATTDLCGAVIIADLRLDQDLDCPAAGLIVAADGIKLNLNGHTITGSGTAAGVLVSGHSNVTIAGGSIVNFFTGVLTSNATGVVIKDMVFRGNTDGVDLQAGSRNIVVKASDFRDHRTRGVMMRSLTEGNDVKDNTFTGNRVGVLVFGTASSTVKDNTISASVLAGIRINFQATGNLVLNNRVDDGPIGIDFISGPAGGPLGNDVIDNSMTGNICGINGVYGGNTLKENEFIGNTADFCG